MTLEHDLLQLARDAMRSLMNGREFGTRQTGYYLNIIRRIEDELSRSEQAKYSDIVSDGGLDPRNKFDAQPEQEPVGYFYLRKDVFFHVREPQKADPEVFPLYTAPPRKELAKPEPTREQIYEKILKNQLAEPDLYFDMPDSHIVKWSILVDQNNFGEPLAQPEQELTEEGKAWGEMAKKMSRDFMENAKKNWEPPPKDVGTITMAELRQTDLYRHIRAELGGELVRFKDGEWSYVRKPWVGLTDEEILSAAEKVPITCIRQRDYDLHFAPIIEAKLKEKNT